MDGPIHPSDETSATRYLVWRTGVDMDLHVAPALARASAMALYRLSPEARVEIEKALEEEISALALQNDQAAQAAANMVRQGFPRRA